jgi:hypothetical protein
LRLSAGQSGSIDVVSRRGVEFAIAVVGQPAFSRLVMVRGKADDRVRAA